MKRRKRKKERDTVLYQKVEKVIRRHDMLKAGDRVAIGVSGGPDSIFLLDALCSLKDKLGIEVFACNLDHAVRGRASHADSRFVVNRAARLGIACFHKRLHGSRTDRSRKLSPEELLREKRYTFFGEAARKFRANIVATGHTLDDQAETVIMRVIQGSTIKGLAGIPPVMKRGGITVIRPLIDITKDEILGSLSKNKISYRVDRSNFEEHFLRNAVRRKILPYLAKYNPRIRRSLALMAESLREDREFIEGEKKKRRPLLNKDGRRVAIKLKDIVIQPKTLQRELIRDALMQSKANIKKLTYRHWKEMDELLRHKRKGHSLDLPGGIMIKRGESEIYFNKRGLNEK